MTEEASENLVRIYLENKDYLVTTNKRLRIKHKVKTRTNKGFQSHNSAYEIDIIAINLRKKDKILGEVKGWRNGLHKYHFRRLHKPTNKLQRQGQRALRIINDKRHKNKLIKKIEKIYGKGFRVVLYADHIAKKDAETISRFMKKKNFDIVTFDEILNSLSKAALNFSYSNEPMMQLLRIQQRRLNRSNNNQRNDR